MPARITLILIDDDPEICRVWQRWLTPKRGFHCLAVFRDAASALAWIAQQRKRPLLALVDWQMPGMNGIQLARRLKRLYPALRVVIITAYQLEELPASAIHVGADGFLHKTMPLAELAPRLREAHAGELPLSGLAARQLVNGWPRAHRKLKPVPRLAARVLAVWACLAEGLSGKEAAERLGISINTLKTYKRRLFLKLGIRSVQQAVTCWHHHAH